jgi:hypothetical protein
MARYGVQKVAAMRGQAVVYRDGYMGVELPGWVVRARGETWYYPSARNLDQLLKGLVGDGREKVEVWKMAVGMDHEGTSAIWEVGRRTVG